VIQIKLSKRTQNMMANLAKKAVEPMGRCGAFLAMKIEESSKRSFEFGKKGSPDSGYSQHWPKWAESTRKAYMGSGIAKRRAQRMSKARRRGRTAVTHSLMWDTGSLVRGIVTRYKVNKDGTATVEVGLRGQNTRSKKGTDVATYGIAHQFGVPSRNLPARPFLGITPAGKKEVEFYIKRQIVDALKGAQ